jgi:hypothetical protein
VRRGTIYRRCTRCRKNFGDGRRCQACQHDSHSWTYVVDVAPLGAPRKVRMKSGFSSKASAIAAMNELQATKVAGTYVEPSKLTLGEYLKLWVAGGCGGVRPWTLRGYKTVVRVHLVPRIGARRLQSLSRSEIKALYGELRESGFARNPTPERLQHLRQMAASYQELRRGPNPRSAVRILVQETGHPEVTVRYWIRRCHQLGMLPGRGPAPRHKRPLREVGLEHPHLLAGRP